MLFVLHLHDYLLCFVFVPLATVGVLCCLVVKRCCEFLLLNDIFDLRVINCLLVYLQVLKISQQVDLITYTLYH